MHIRSQYKREIRFLLIIIPITVFITWFVLSTLQKTQKKIGHRTEGLKDQYDKIKDRL